MTSEYAAAGLTDDALRTKLRHAAPHIRLAVDRSREVRGLSPLWPTETASLPTVAGPRIARERRRSLPQRVLIGLAAPGISSPVNLKNECFAMPETIAPSAWACVDHDVRAGKAFPFTLGHSGRVLLRSNDPRVTMKIDPLAGLVFTIREDSVGGILPWPGSCWCSIGLVPLDYRFRRVGGQMIREIREMGIDHIALLSPASGAFPAYPLSKVRSVKPENAARESLRLLVDTRLAVKDLGL